MPRDNFAAEDGRFALEDIGEGEYVVDVTAPERAPAVVSDVKVAAGATVDVGTVRLTAGGVVRGLVVDAASAPVAGAWASISGPVRDFSRSAPEVTTDAGGAFEFRGVPPGAAQVTVTHPSYAPGTASGLDVDPARGPVETRVVLTQGGRIEGRVRARSGVLPPGAAVYVNPMRDGGWGSGPPMQSLAPDGTFVVEHVPVGRAGVMLMSGRQGDYRTVAQVDAEVREAETTSVELSLRNIAVSGKVTRGGAPLAGARVELESARGTMWFGGGGGPDELPPNVGITADDGTYHLMLGEPGEVYVDIQTPDRKSHLATNVQVPDAESYTGDFSFPGTSVEGVVADGETDQPVAGALVTAQPKDPKRGAAGTGSYGESDAEGRFHLDLDAGEYLVNARMEGYGGDAVPVTVGDSNVTGVRVVVRHGLSLKGKVVDAAGRGVGGVTIRGTTMEAANRFNVAGRTLPDGSFELSGVRTGRYAIAAIAGGSFAIATGATPGGRPTTLALSPGGRVRVKVLRPDGAPAAAGTYARPSGLPGVRLFLPGGEVDASGVVEFAAPAGQVEITATSSDGTLEARTMAAVEVGATASVELTLKPSEEGR
jgi:hypothetical protein